MDKLTKSRLACAVIATALLLSSCGEFVLPTEPQGILSLRDAKNNYEFTLTLCGHLTDEAGTPADGINVIVTASRDISFENPGDRMGVDTLTTNSAGFYQLQATTLPPRTTAVLLNYTDPRGVFAPDSLLVSNFASQGTSGTVSVPTIVLKKK